jgi:hypothetical protein
MIELKLIGRALLLDTPILDFISSSSLFLWVGLVWGGFQMGISKNGVFVFFFLYFFFPEFKWRFLFWGNLDRIQALDGIRGNLVKNAR